MCSTALPPPPPTPITLICVPMLNSSIISIAMCDSNSLLAVASLFLVFLQRLSASSLSSPGSSRLAPPAPVCCDRWPRRITPVAGTVQQGVLELVHRCVLVLGLRSCRGTSPWH